MHRFFKMCSSVLIACILIATWTLDYNTIVNWPIVSLRLQAKDCSDVYGTASSDNNIEKITIATVSCGKNRSEETLTLLKSAILFSRKLVLHVILFTDEDNIYQFAKNLKDFSTAAVRWNVSFQYEIHPVGFPKESAKEWKKLFRPCAAQRLFFPNILPSTDALLYLDTDALIVSDLRSVWRHFQSMNSSQVIAVSRETENRPTGVWAPYNGFTTFPYYPPSGLNSGVMLMNLTRLRQFQWEDKIINYYKQYRKNIMFGDQDLINIIFHFYPGDLYILSCAYNYRTDHCRNGSKCKAAEEEGIYVLHGNRRVFHTENDLAFRKVYQIAEKFNLSSDDSLFDFIQPIVRKDDSVNKTQCAEVLTPYFRF